MPFHLGVENVTHCLLVETDDGLVLVDTGLGLRDYTAPVPFVRAFMALNRVPRDPEKTAVRQVMRLGFAPEDVRQIVLTHLHVDHTGGLADFPWARVHVYAREYEAAMGPRGISVKDRFYVRAHWAHGPEWVVHSCAGGRWMGMDCVRVVEGEEVEVLLVPLPGHTRGHCGVAVGKGEEWLLHCGDAYIRDSQVGMGAGTRAFPGWARWVERWLFPEESVRRLRELRRVYGGKVRLFCSHDPEMFFRLGGR
ncbi:MAG TPA: MBL fold metallo-hydrolase [Thermoflexia bacterium]|nr:MBL fold metallo-hydrolase [Thermoflexia bacterium]